jgi:hypothetical protein
MYGAGGPGYFVLELLLLTVEVSGVWHVCGTADPLLRGSSRLPPLPAWFQVAPVSPCRRVIAVRPGSLPYRARRTLRRHRALSNVTLVSSLSIC